MSERPRIRARQPGEVVLHSLPPLSLYVHVPWCVRKCPYCDFNSHAVRGDLPEARYIDALLEDLDEDLGWVEGRPLISIFFGGGTPSLFSPDSVARLLQGVAARIAWAADMEVTLEANPGTIERGRFAGYRQAGVNRVSLGVQTFSAPHLQILGRIHSPADVLRSVDELQQAGLENFNLDLMYGLPQQSIAEALADLRSALELGPTHISHYQLTLEPGTVFYHRPPPLPDPDVLWEMQVACQALLAERGYQQYEVSAYARPGRTCRHNLNYWQFGDYLGIGAGAHGKLTTSSGDIVRTSRRKQPREYLSVSAAERKEEVRTVPTEELPFEYMLNVLRLRAGFTGDDFQARTGLPIAQIDDALGRAAQRGLLEASPAGWRPTELGHRFLNDLQALFLD